VTPNFINWRSRNERDAAHFFAPDDDDTVSLGRLLAYRGP
jgi:hypothetical protein